MCSGGRINGGQEYLTVFNGLTGAAIHTIAYYPNRNAKAELSEASGTFNWDDAVARATRATMATVVSVIWLLWLIWVDQMLIPVVYSAVDITTYAYIWAVDFDGTQLKTRWLHSSDSNRHRLA